MEYCRSQLFLLLLSLIIFLEIYFIWNPIKVEKPLHFAVASWRKNSIFNTSENINKIVLHCYYRGGSTLTSGLFSEHNSVFYSYEPLRPVRNNLKQIAGKCLQEMFACNFSSINKAANEDKNTRHSESWRIKYFCGIWDHTKRKKCRKKPLPYLENNCKKYQTRVIKVIRLHDIRWISDLVNEVKVIHVIRDPRARLSSIAEIKGTHSELLRLVCQNCQSALSDDLLMKNSIIGKGAKYTLVRYEDMVFKPRITAERLRQFAEVPPDDSMENWIKNLEEGQDDNRRYNKYLTNRKYPQLSVTKWKKVLSYNSIKKIESCCYSYMKYFGYELMTHQ